MGEGEVGFRAGEEDTLRKDALRLWEERASRRAGRDDCERREGGRRSECWEGSTKKKRGEGRDAYGVVREAGIAAAGGGGGAGGGYSFLFSLALCMATNFGHAIVVAVHAVNAVTCLCEDELVDSVVADLALEAVGVIRVIAGHDGLVEDGLVADVAIVAAVCADGGTIGEEKEVGVCGDLVVALCTLEAVDMEEGLPGRVNRAGRCRWDETTHTRTRRRDRPSR